MSNNNNKVKTYTILDFPKEGETYGKFQGNIPKKAADKALNLLMKFVDFNDDYRGKFVVFNLQNVENKKEYKYVGSRIKLEKPRVVYKNGTRVEYLYKNIIGKYTSNLDDL
jgi:hypothetical protein